VAKKKGDNLDARNTDAQIDDHAKRNADNNDTDDRWRQIAEELKRG